MTLKRRVSKLEGALKVKEPFTVVVYQRDEAGVMRTWPDNGVITGQPSATLVIELVSVPSKYQDGQSSE